MPGAYPQRGPRRRRFDHAHRVRQPVGAVDRGSLRDDAGSQRRLRPGPAMALGLAVVAALALVLQPWDGVPGSAAEARQTGEVRAATQAPARGGGLAVSPTLGPHGDLVTSRAASDADIARWEDVHRAHAGRPAAPSRLSGYRWPLSNARITNAFGLGRPGSFIVAGQSFHDGLDISSFCGARITAAHDGIVLGAGRRTEGLLGWLGDLAAFRAKVDEKNAWGGQAITVVVDDGNGYRSIYAHLGVAVVEPGEVVRAGDLLGYQGASGHATGCHLHYALFSPREQATLALDPKIARKTKLPPLEIARIDPLLVLPPPESAQISWGWGAR